MADIGYVALILALIFSAYAAFASIANLHLRQSALALSARNGLIAAVACYTLAMEIMLYALITDDFSIELVAMHSSRDTALIYKFTAIYSDKAGSLMFWGWLVSVFSLLLIYQKRQAFRRLVEYAVGMLSVIVVFFLILITMVLDVFEGVPFTPADGVGLNPQLENLGMVLHPPLLFLGYAAFAVVFGFVMGALIAGDAVTGWIGSIRRWALFGWCTLGLANLVGAWWAWDVGNWGGYWAWDPVENAGLMPWLVATALVHSIAVGRRRGYLTSWIAPLVILVFCFTLLSPFITHGGLEDSPLHGFKDSPVPSYIGWFMVLVFFGSFALVLKRRQWFRDEKKPQSAVSRERAFLLGNVVLLLIVLLVLIGTVLPGVAEEFGDRQVDIERSFFDWTAGPALLVLVLLMGLCPVLAWRKSSMTALRRDGLPPLVLSLIAAAGLLVSGWGNGYALAAIVCGFPVFAILREWGRGTQVRHRNRGENYVQALVSLVWGNRSRHGGLVVHIGIVLITLGVIGSSLHSADWMVNLMWIGGGVLLAGGIIAIWPDRGSLVSEAD